MPEERIICLSSRYPKPGPPERSVERAVPGFPIWPCSRWGFPCLVDYSSSCGLLPHLFTLAADTQLSAAVCFLWHCPSKSRLRLSSRVYPTRTSMSYAASRPVEFGLSSPITRWRDRSDSPPFQNRPKDTEIPWAKQGFIRTNPGNQLRRQLIT